MFRRRRCAGCWSRRERSIWSRTRSSLETTVKNPTHRPDHRSTRELWSQPIVLTWLQPRERKPTAASRLDRRSPEPVLDAAVHVELPAKQRRQHRHVRSGPDQPRGRRDPRWRAGCTGTDQRGVTRPQGAGCDIGADEVFQPIEATEAAKFSGQVATTPSGGAYSPPTIEWGDRQTSEATVKKPVSPAPTHTPRRGRSTGLITYTGDVGSGIHTVPFKQGRQTPL